jgi:hypothetical protein
MNEDERLIAHDLFREMQYELKNLKRTGTNPMFKSDYITLDTMLDAVKPLAYKHNFVLRQDMVNLQMLERVAVVTVCTSIIHKSGASFSSSVDIPTAKVDAHGVGGAITYGKRYSLANLFAITADSDDDGNSTISQAKPQQSAPQQAYQPRQQRPISKPLTQTFDTFAE